MVPTSFRVSPAQAAILLWHVLHCDDADNDADRTVMEIYAEIDANDGVLSKGLLESALYCCNMEDERGKFWHPLGHSFDQFVRRLIPHKELRFHKYYNSIFEVKPDGSKTKTSKDPAVGAHPRRTSDDNAGDEV